MKRKKLLPNKGKTILDDKDINEYTYNELSDKLHKYRKICREADIMSFKFEKFRKIVYLIDDRLKEMDKASGLNYRASPFGNYKKLI